MENWNRREGGEEKALEITSISLCSFTNIYRTKNMPIDSRKPTYFTVFVNSIYIFVWRHSIYTLISVQASWRRLVFLRSIYFADCRGFTCASLENIYALYTFTTLTVSAVARTTKNSRQLYKFISDNMYTYTYYICVLHVRVMTQDVPIAIACNSFGQAGIK